MGAFFGLILFILSAIFTLGLIAGAAWIGIYLFKRFDPEDMARKAMGKK